ncbi:unnamed protein product [Moneuplotes crassus]|uniref:Uncharacterized protein n=1 Tax=Euplotes crassus TaxID=5936 RepID=A0AAD1XUK8_EUPCR|nr:unnamed protein product [Moneuplotes crassus]
MNSTYKYSKIARYWDNIFGSKKKNSTNEDFLKYAKKVSLLNKSIIQDLHEQISWSDSDLQQELIQKIFHEREDELSEFKKNLQMKSLPINSEIQAELDYLTDSEMIDFSVGKFNVPDLSHLPSPMDSPCYLALSLNITDSTITCLLQAVAEDFLAPGHHVLLTYCRKTGQKLFMPQ